MNYLLRFLCYATMYDSLVTGSCQGITFDYIGLGSLRTWHGSPDCSARGGSGSAVQVILPRHEEVDTDGGSMKHEAKLVIKRHKNLPQLVSMNVVASFTAASRHPTMNTLIPSLLISKDEAIVSIYCSRSNILLISKTVTIATYLEDSGEYELTKKGLLFLWLFTNHR